MGEPLGILLISGGHERAHYAFVIGAGAAAVGRTVIVFATNEGCRSLMRDWSEIEDSKRDMMVRERGVAGLEELRQVVVELGGRLMVCESGMRMAGAEAKHLMVGIEVAGISTFLSAVGTGQIVTL